jgi:hypothetical protein
LFWAFFSFSFFKDKQRHSAAAALRPWEWAWAGVGNGERGRGWGCVWGVCVCVCPLLSLQAKQRNSPPKTPRACLSQAPTKRGVCASPPAALLPVDATHVAAVPSIPAAIFASVLFPTTSQVISGFDFPRTARIAEM